MASCKTKHTFLLELTAEEAAWLKAVCQNPLCDTESDDNARFREAIFEAFKNQSGFFPSNR